MDIQPGQEPPSNHSARMAVLLAVIENELGSLSPYFAVMRRQLIGAVSETDAGVMAVIERISEVHVLSSGQRDRIQDSMDQCTVLVEVTRKQAGYNQQVVAIVRAELQAQLAELNSNIQRTQGLADEVGELRKIVELITDIAGQTHLLAINAAIQATHAGHAGATFKVIAAEVKALSHRTSSAAKEIASKISSLAKKMSMELAAAKNALLIKTADSHLGKIIKDISAIEARFDSTSGELLKFMGNIQTSNNDVVTQLTEALGFIQFQDVVRQRVEQVEKALQEVTEHAQLMIGNLADDGWDGTLQPTLKERMDHHMSSYVMASQRDTHASVFGGQSPGRGDGPAIELF